MLARRFACLALPLALLACSGGGGGGGGGTPQPTTANWAGDWTLTATQVSTTCVPDPGFAPITDSITISINAAGTMATLSSGADLPIVNGRIQGYSALDLTAYDWGLTGVDSFGGTQTSKVGCDVVFQVSAVRGGGPGTALIAGTWTVTEDFDSGTCQAGPPWVYELTITVSGGTAQISRDGGPAFSLPVVDGTVITGSRVHDGTTENYNFGVPSGDSNSVGGSVTRTSATCTATYVISGTRGPRLPPSASDWNGTWNITGTQVSTTCVPDPMFPPQSITSTFTINAAGTMVTLFSGVEVPLVGSRIQGYSAFNLTDYDLELTGTNSFTGTQSSVTGFNPTCSVVFQLTGVRAGS